MQDPVPSPAEPHSGEDTELHPKIAGRSVPFISTSVRDCPYLSPFNFMIFFLLFVVN